MTDSKLVAAISRSDLTQSGSVDTEFKKPVVLPRVSCFAHDGARQLSAILPEAPLPPTTFSSTSKIPFTFDKDAFSEARDFVLRARITVATSSVRIAPTTHWNQFITITSMNKGSVEIQRLHPEAHMAMLCTRPSDEMEALAEAIGYNPKTLWQASTQAAGTSRYYYIVIPAWFMSGLGWNGFRDQPGKIEIAFNPVGNIIMSGTGTATLDEMVLLVTGDRGGSLDAGAAEAASLRYTMAGHYLNSETITTTAQTFTAGATQTINLQNLSHKTAALLVGFVASNTTNAGGASQLYQSLGGATSAGGATVGGLDILTSSSKSMFGDGQPVPAHYFKTLAAAGTFNKAYNQNIKIYPIIFCKSLRAAIGGGQIDGFFQFDSKSYQLQVRLPPAGTSEVHTVTLSAAATSGSIRLGWTDPVSGITSWTNDLASNTTAANLALAFNALESVIQSRLSAAFSAAFSAGTTVTVTYPSR